MKWPLEPKDVTTRYITESTLLCEGPCLLVGALGTEGDGAVATALLYDGVEETGEGMALLGTTWGHSTEYSPPVPVSFRMGIYVYITGVCGLTVQFVKLQQGE